MKNIDIICFGANLTSFFAFSLFFNYWQVFDGNELFLAQMVASVTSFFSSAQPVLEPSFAASAFSVTEHIGIIVFMVVTIIVSLIALSVACIKRVKFGKNRFFIPLVFSSVGVVVCAIYTSLKYGVHLVA